MYLCVQTFRDIHQEKNTIPCSNEYFGEIYKFCAVCNQILEIITHDTIQLMVDEKLVAFSLILTHFM